MKEYAAVFEKTSNGWSAYVPDLPGLGVAAKTIDQTKQLLREGIELHIAGMREDGLPIPEPQTQVMRLAISA
ncbi:MAG: type II toxin-antitoxin system HicB family antitoxin [Terracidiphilus sp.]